MKWKAAALLLFVMIVPLIIRIRLIVYMAEEAFVVLLAVAVGMIVALSVLILFAFLSEGIKVGFQRLLSKYRGTGALHRGQLVQPKAARFPSPRDERAIRGVAGSRIDAREHSA